MSDIIHMIGAAMQREAETLRIIGLNVANTETAAYRRQVPVTRMQFTELLADAPMPQVETTMSVAVDQRSGSFERTGEPLHVAIDGPGFLMLASKAGTVLTRRGELQVSADNTLVAANGDAVLGVNGVIRLGTGKPAIDARGNVLVDGEIVAQLRVVEVTDSATLEPLGAGTYRADSAALAERNVPSLHPGFLETSNVAPLEEIVQLMETMRRFEAQQKFVQAHASMLDTAIAQLGKTR